MKKTISNRKLIHIYLDRGPNSSPIKQQNLADLPYCSSFRVKNAWHRLWNFSPRLRIATKARYIPEVSLHRGWERPLHKALKMNPGFHGRLWDVGDVRVLEYLSKGAADQVWSLPKRRKCVTVNKMKGVGHLKSALTSHTEMQQLQFFLLFVCFGLASVQYLLMMYPFFLSGMVMYILLHCWKCVISFFIFILWGLQLRDCHESWKRLWTLDF